LGQFAASSLNLGKKVGVEVVSNSVVMIGKWSLPTVLDSMNQTESRARVAHARVRSTCVRVLYVLKCMGEQSCSRVRGDW